MDAILGRMRWSVADVERVKLDAGGAHVVAGPHRFVLAVDGPVEIRGAEERQRLAAGELAILPGDAVRVLRASAAVVITGALRSESGETDLITRLLPPLVHACGLLVHEPAMAGVIAGLDDEARRGGTLLGPLVSVVVGPAIRVWVASGCGTVAGWVGALRDPDVARVVRAIHDDPAAPWTIDTLAGLVHTSRSRLAELFRARVGCSPMRYLAEVRMSRAKDLLRAGLPVAQVAVGAGYGSEASFSRAFRRHVGEPPHAWRRSAQSGDLAIPA
ncbi:AraC family transcriptional regulator [Microbacterium rhizophilus]|uniref:AraC family transcriptional regulator n=1 Tax=Microbacterium rhizophilus TaxID=3138934 RepID=UPI0031EE6700